MWHLHYVEGGKSTTIGAVRIADIHDHSQPAFPDTFEILPNDFFSLGGEDEYYERLNTFGTETRLEILRSLRDVALDLALFRKVEHLQVTSVSLLRSITTVTVQTQLHRIAMGGVKLSPYSFSYFSPEIDRNGNPTQACRLDFEVNPEANPRTNVHVLIGRNGVGKSFTLNDIATALAQPGREAGKLEFQQREDRLLTSKFANVVSVAYSAFDAFEPGPQSSAEGAIGYEYIGLKKPTAIAPGSAGLKNHSALADEFRESFKKVVDRQHLSRWQHYLEFLKGDTLFGETVGRMMGADSDDFYSEVQGIFGELSSGHKIVLLILTRLVETVEEATLVLIDEPESHLHPPLLSAFMSALSQLLEDRNGVAIMATHSPVVVQEVPSNCVLKLFGSGNALTAQRPIIETYGENVGTLTQDIFGLEVTAAGFHRALLEAVQNGGSYEQILADFGDRLGAEARVLLQSMIFFAGQ